IMGVFWNLYEGLGPTTTRTEPTGGQRNRDSPTSHEPIRRPRSRYLLKLLAVTITTRGGLPAVELNWSPTSLPAEGTAGRLRPLLAKGVTGRALRVEEELGWKPLLVACGWP
ncbi:hypothetical protein Dimus_012814, partial [Dionaea muscipula]